MKKTSKLFGAIALSTALAMGCAVPAFATDPTVGGSIEGTDMSTPDAPGDTDHDGMHTDVAVKTQISNISVAVPLNVTIVASSEGGTINAPSAGVKNITGGTASVSGYRIENTSSFPVEIVDVASAAAGTEWAISGTTYNKGLLTMTLAPSAVSNAVGGNAQNATGVNEGDRTGAQKSINIDGTSQTAGWKIAGGGSTTNPRIMGLSLAGTSSALKNVGAVTDTTNSLTAAEDAFTVSFTVAATTLTADQQIS